MEDEENILFDEDNELNLESCRELIELVKINELLWKKRCLSYKDQQMKKLCWSTIGSALSCELSGKLYDKNYKYVLEL